MLCSLWIGIQDVCIHWTGLLGSIFKFYLFPGYLNSSTGEKTPSNLASFYQPDINTVHHILLDIPHHQALTPSSCALLKKTFLFVLDVIIVIPSHLTLQKIYALNIKSGDSLHLKEQTCLR